MRLFILCVFITGCATIKTDKTPVITITGNSNNVNVNVTETNNTSHDESHDNTKYNNHYKESPDWTKAPIEHKQSHSSFQMTTKTKSAIGLVASLALTIGGITFANYLEGTKNKQIYQLIHDTRDTKNPDLTCSESHNDGYYNMGAQCQSFYDSIDTNKTLALFSGGTGVFVGGTLTLISSVFLATNW